MKLTPWTLLSFSLSFAYGHPPSGCSVTAVEGATAILPLNLNLTRGSKLSKPSIKWKMETDEVVHHYRYCKDYNEYQDERFKGRTSLFEEEITKGNVSLEIFNVTKRDEGNYTCEVLHKDPDIEMNYKVSLCVEEEGGNKPDTDPKEKTTPKQPGQTPMESTETEHEPALGPGVIVGIVFGVLIGLAATIYAVLFTKKTTETCETCVSPGEDNYEMETLRGGDPGAGGQSDS